MTEDKIDIVKERLSFIAALTKAKQNFRGDELSTNNIRNGALIHPYKHYSALRFYLLLTCFDILGQTAEFIDFNSWLHSKRHAEERKKIFDECKNADDHIFMTSVYRKYNDIYGVSNSFFRFINHVLSDENRNKLFNSIRVTKQTKIEPKEIIFEPTIKMKTDYLYLVRNSFTHKGKLLASVGGGLWDVFDEDVNLGFHSVYMDERKDYIYSYWVSSWPKILIEIIEDTIKNVG